VTPHVCRHCASPDIDAEERVPRFVAIAIDGLDDHGHLNWTYDPTNRDEAEWEGSELIGFRCSGCDEAAEDLADLVQMAPAAPDER
jgi:hypothetical protein